MEQLKNEIRNFYEERDWKQFHSPKNVVMDLASEVGELLDHFRWLTEAESYRPKNLEEVREELGDVFISLLNLSDRLGVDIVEAARKKLNKTSERYPVEKCRGKATKYTAYESTSPR